MVFLKIEVQLIYNVVLVSGVQQSDSVIYMHTHICSFFRFFSIIQDIEYSSLHCTVGHCNLSCE